MKIREVGCQAKEEYTASGLGWEGILSQCGTQINGA